MSNRYSDNFIYAVDNLNQIHLVEYYYLASMGCAYHSLTCVNNKTYSVFESAEADDEGYVDMCTEKEGSFLPCIWVDDCCSFFSNRTSNNMKKVIEEAELEKTNIVKLICLDFNSTCKSIYAATGWIITKDGKCSVDSAFFEKVISTDADVEKVADNIVHQLI